MDDWHWRWHLGLSSVRHSCNPWTCRWFLPIFRVGMQLSCSVHGIHSLLTAAAKQSLTREKSDGKPTRHSRQLRAVIPASQKWNVLVFTRNKSDLHGGQTQRQIHRPTAQRCSKLYPSTGNNYPGRVIKTTQLLQKTIFNVSLMRRRKFRDGNERIH